MPVSNEAQDQPATSQLTAQSGIVALFDILGYQQFLAANPPQMAAERVLSFLSALPDTCAASLKELLGKGDPRIVKELESHSIKWLVFSDTILLTCPLEGDQETLGKRWLTFLGHCGMLSRQMFEYGLPIRGAVAVGTFFIQGLCFAGIPIVEAYNLLTQLDIAACVMTESARTEIIRDLEGRLTRPIALAYDYLIPLKNSSEKIMFVIPPLAPSIFNNAEDIRQYVNDAFRGHGKDLPREAYQKMVNTEMFLRGYKTRTLAARAEAAAGAKVVQK